MNQATTDKLDVAFLPALQMRLLFIEGLPIIEMKQWFTAGVHPPRLLQGVGLHEEMSTADEEQLLEQISRKYDQLEVQIYDMPRGSLRA